MARRVAHAEVIVEPGPSAAAVAASRHGGRLAAAMAVFPHAPTPWIDLSTGINTHPWVGPRASAEMLARLPDPAQVAELEAVAARAFGVADPARVVATAGAEAGLRWLSRLLRFRVIQIVSPTYGSHEDAWRRAGAEVGRIPVEALGNARARALLLVNPNNPDGHACPADRLAAVVRQRAARDRWTLVDESFVETAPELSVAALESERLVVFRSFGKFYGLPGVRLGFVIAPPDLAARLRAVQGDWPVGADAIAMGTAAYADTAWQARARLDLDRQAAELDALLARADFTVVGGTSLFRLISVADGVQAFETLARSGILTRPFGDRPHWLRLGLPRPEQVDRLAHALMEVRP